MRLKTLIPPLLLCLAVSPAIAQNQYLVRIPANVNLSASAPETPAEPISVALSPEALPAATVNEPYSFNLADRLSITGGTGSYNLGDVAWSLKGGGSLPPGLALSNGTIAGTPTTKNEAGVSFEVTGTYQDASGQQSYTIVVNGVKITVTQISAGVYHTCALTTSSGIKCWGLNSSRQLGDGSTSQRETPVDVKDLDGKAIKVSAGEYHTCALLNDGRVRCWGRNEEGQLGIGRISTNEGAPQTVIGIDNNAIDIATGDRHSCALIQGGTMKCWGNNNLGQIGTGGSNTTGRTSALDVIVLNEPVKFIAAGEEQTCAINISGTALCWGSNRYGKFGAGYSGGSSRTPFLIESVSDFRNISLAKQGDFACGVTGSGHAYCWGNGSSGKLGNGSSSNSNIPVKIENVENAKEISANGNHGCLVTESGAAKCWGNGTDRLGTGIVSNPFPENVLTLSEGVVSISTGIDHSCALMIQGKVKCWGSDKYGNLGDNQEIVPKTTPADVTF